MNSVAGSAVVVPFQFQSNEIRTVTIDGEPWFVAKDICDAIDHSNVSEAIKRIPPRHLTSVQLRSGGQLREVNAVSEPGLYRLVLRSDKPQAEPFMEWVTEEVLPAIRKTGGYGLPGASLSKEMVEQIALVVAQMLPAMLREAVPAIIDHLSQAQQPLLPRMRRLLFVGDAHLGSTDYFIECCCQTGSDNVYVAKDDLYEAYRAYCGAFHSCHPESKPNFLGKLYQLCEGTCSAEFMISGDYTHVVRGITLLDGYETIIKELQRKQQERAAEELNRRMEALA